MKMALWLDIFGHVNEGRNAATECILGLRPNPLIGKDRSPIFVFIDDFADVDDTSRARE